MIKAFNEMLKSTPLAKINGWLMIKQAIVGFC
jgi:hypothetical protein